jgi:hypothetical protein
LLAQQADWLFHHQRRGGDAVALTLRQKSSGIGAGAQRG